MVQTFSDNQYIYSVDMMFAYLNTHKHPAKKISVNEYKDGLEQKSWGDPAAGIYYSALDVITHPRKYKNEYKRILKANLSYPIIISLDGFIIDGVHRLTKAYLHNKKEIKAYIFDKQLMKKFIIAKKGEWGKVDKMKMYDFIKRYVDRFC